MTKFLAMLPKDPNEWFSIMVLIGVVIYSFVSGGH